MNREKTRKKIKGGGELGEKKGFKKKGRAT